MSYDPTAIEVAGRTFVDTASDSGITVIYGNQRSPRPAHPFATVTVLEDIPVQMKSSWTLSDTPDGDDFEGKLDTEREVTFSVQFFGKDAYDQARSTVDRLGRPDISRINRENGLAYRRRGSLTRIYEDLSRTIENRTTFTVTFGYRISQTFAYPAIDRVIATGEDGLDGLSIDEDIS